MGLGKCQQTQQRPTVQWRIWCKKVLFWPMTSCLGSSDNRAAAASDKHCRIMPKAILRWEKIRGNEGGGRGAQFFAPLIGIFLTKIGWKLLCLAQKRESPTDPTVVASLNYSAKFVALLTISGAVSDSFLIYLDLPNELVFWLKRDDWQFREWKRREKNEDWGATSGANASAKKKE